MLTPASGVRGILPISEDPLSLALHEVVCLRNRGLTAGDFPVSRELTERSVWIFHHALLAEEDQVCMIADAVSKVLDHRDELA